MSQSCIDPKNPAGERGPRSRSSVCRALPLAQTPTDVLVVGHVAELQTLDPAQAVTISDFRILINIYDGLLHYKDGSLEVEPGLAEAWDVLAGWQDLHLHPCRKGVKFHDGTEFNADAVKFNFDRVLDANHPLPQYGDRSPSCSRSGRSTRCRCSIPTRSFSSTRNPMRRP